MKLHFILLILLGVNVMAHDSLSMPNIMFEANEVTFDKSQEKHGI